MDASIVGCIENVDKAYRVIEHNDKMLKELMSKDSFKKLLFYSLKKGYESLSEITDEDIENFKIGG